MSAVSKGQTGSTHVHSGCTKESIQTLFSLLGATNVKRYHTFPIIGEQPVGQHSHRVALLCNYLTDGNASGNLIKAALFHDLAEIATGDIPATTKWAHPAFDQMLEIIEDGFEIDHDLKLPLSPYEWTVLKVADMLELCFFAYEQRRLGNRNAKDLYQRGISYLLQMVVPEPAKSNMDAILYKLSQGQML